MIRGIHGPTAGGCGGVLGVCPNAERAQAWVCWAERVLVDGHRVQQMARGQPLESLGWGAWPGSSRKAQMGENAYHHRRLFDGDHDL